jgi:glycosyltransferase involved in cell wall biosynthesis
VAAEGNTDPLVSVVMPVWNLAPVLPRAIESVLAQTLADIELIIVDDASTDGTPDVIEHYRQTDERVQVVRNATNSRRSNIEWEPRNNGLQIARGAFIAYLDGDNAWDPKALEVLSEFLVNSPGMQLAYCRSRNFHDPAEIDAVILADSRAATARGEDWVIFAHEELDVAELGRSQYIDTNEMMHRASVFRALGSMWHTAHPRRAYVNGHQGKRCPYRRHNDLDLAERIIAAFGSDSVVQVPEVLVDYYYPSALHGMLPAEAQR